MSTGKITISEASDYAEIGEYWDSHDLADVWDQTSEAHFRIELCAQDDEAETSEDEQ